MKNTALPTKLLNRERRQDYGGGDYGGGDYGDGEDYGGGDGGVVNPPDPDPVDPNPSTDDDGSYEDGLGGLDNGEDTIDPGGDEYPPHSSNGDKIADAITRTAGSTSTGYCATAVRQAVESALNIRLDRVNDAKDYGPSLTSAGFEVVTDGVNQSGDIRIIQPVSGHPSGHMEVYTSTGWKSDFVQRDEWPGPAYRNADPKPSYTQYRHN
ncbi:unnamed protein product [Didymodactylos carnosus]|uniref:Uncharacterized protein n=1 Tax=Didymodactylos carnosus TaxID=1234261 RepID=A0A815KDH4_9BILA|nr:unnamed protein product [Didymodactylos carnosus]CAF4288590.1 unnamed protein product [Didymodactylos carnosus]